ncbi:hypothetical protein CAEBREN_04818 [Caenorhabditis brenneri]|uniref:Fe2OG dioxygenase domain-containing protein n=1 Tax=Caenorhabditis brenneri TaxID=135651 RepID=G0MGZ9_CAEBE|nr:hypothetical protein CAEBREN_04818 [Caenorhabditis brenneri]
MKLNDSVKKLILTSVVCLIIYSFPSFNEVNHFLYTNSVFSLSKPEKSSTESEPKFVGEEHWSTEEQELCKNPDVDKIWTRADALCFLKRRGLGFSKMEIVSWSNPVLVVYRDMFSQKQIKGYSRIVEKCEMEEEEVVDEHGNVHVSSVRVVNGSLTEVSLYPEVRSLVETAARHIPAMNFKYSEQVLGLSYLPGGHYSAHHDFLEFQGEAPEHAHLEEGNRIATFIISVEKADVGGGTVFPYLKTTVRANPGDAYIWFNMLENQEIDDMSYHGGCPVISGKKLIATTWLRSKGQHIFERVEGKRQSFHAKELLR